jgi:hypothetical protein
MTAKPLITAGVLISLVWLFVVCLLAIRFRVPSADGIMYSLPFAATGNPFDFGIPFLNNFREYGSSWGHHWPGSMWLRGFIFQIVPYSRLGDVAVLSTFQLMSAFMTGMLVWKTTGRMTHSAAAVAIVLSDRLLILCCSGNRFEAIPIAAILVLYAGSRETSSGWRSEFHRWMGPPAAFLCAVLHPYSLILGGTIVLWDCIVPGLRGSNAHTGRTPRLAAFLLGCSSLVAWFLADPEAYKQFAINMELQNSFYHNWNSVIDGLSNYRLHAGLILWASALACLPVLFSSHQALASSHIAPLRAHDRYLAPLLFLMTIAVHTLTRCENFNYLAIGTPFAVIIVFTTLPRLERCLPPSFRWLATTAIAAIALLHASVLPHRILQFWKAGMPDLHREYTDVLKQIPPGRTVYIPHSLWPAAAEDKTHTIRWFTFPVASRRDVREDYERLAYQETMPGDILIIENSGARRPDRFGLYPTFKIIPPDPSIWQHVRDHEHTFTGSIPWGIDLSVYEFRE